MALGITQQTLYLRKEVLVVRRSMLAIKDLEDPEEEVDVEPPDAEALADHRQEEGDGGDGQDGRQEQVDGGEQESGKEHGGGEGGGLGW